MAMVIKDAKRSDIFTLSPDRVRLIGFDTDHKAGEHILYQDRVHEPFDEALVQSMLARGFTSVVDVRKDGELFEVIAGRRRVKAAREAARRMIEDGLEPLKIVIQVKRMNTELDLLEHVISENALRKNPNAIQMARDLNLMLSLGATREQAARAIGKGLQSLDNYLKLLDLSPMVQNAITSGRIKPAAALALVPLAREDQEIELAKIFSGQKKPTAANVNAAVKAKQSGDDEANPAPKKRLVHKLIAHADAEAVFGVEGVAAIRFVLGELNPNQIKGLKELIRKVGSAKTKAS
jgi:ParB family transcriptional regulator, chromosome partitioning protein